ncbi:hypothetical protein CK820_G0001286 [Pan troglodytes]|uniref:Uncharacterized protein n=1 Tax=Pan troglodytes TaxID=9598 RepID=A0A2J8PPS3_PANTR|nr:hypothetical protein CK820_G0001286 [Pan troglodytes]
MLPDRLRSPLDHHGRRASSNSHSRRSTGYAAGSPCQLTSRGQMEIFQRLLFYLRKTVTCAILSNRHKIMTDVLSELKLLTIYHFLLCQL